MAEILPGKLESLLAGWSLVLTSWNVFLAGLSLFLAGCSLFLANWNLFLNLLPEFVPEFSWN